MVRHSAYLDALTSIKDPTTLAWKETVAGLVVLRLVDEWFDGSTSVVLADIGGLEETRTAINAIPREYPIYSVLHGIVNTLTTKGKNIVSILIIAPKLFQYGRLLFLQGQWSLSKDLFTTILNRAQDANHSKTIAYTAQRLGFTNRRMGLIDEATSAYLLADSLALETGQLNIRLNAQIGMANLAVDHGDKDLQGAYEMLSRIGAEAKLHNLHSVLVDVLHLQASIRQRQKNYIDSIRLGVSALKYADTSEQKTKALGLLAASATTIGDFSTGRHLHQVILTTAQEEWDRQMALINLMELATWEKHTSAFHAYRRPLSTMVMQPFMQAHYQLFLGNGYQTFGQKNKATTAYAEAEKVANQYGLRFFP